MSDALVNAMTGSRPIPASHRGRDHRHGIVDG